jgi:hypothetical protein
LVIRENNGFGLHHPNNSGGADNEGQMKKLIALTLVLWSCSQNQTPCHCSSGYYCSDGKCVAVQNLADACSSACQSGIPTAARCPGGMDLAACQQMCMDGVQSMSSACGRCLVENAAWEGAYCSDASTFCEYHGPQAAPVCLKGMVDATGHPLVCNNDDAAVNYCKFVLSDPSSVQCYAACRGN